MSTPNHLSEDSGSTPVQDIITFDGAEHPTVTYLDAPLDASDELREWLGPREIEVLYWRREHAIRAHNKVLELEQSEVAGADWQRVRSFMAGLGAPATALRVLARDAFNHAVSYEAPPDTEEVKRSGGIYLSKSDVALVKHGSREAENDSTLGYEKTAVHELGHAWGTKRYISIGVGNIRIEHPAFGFMQGGERNNLALEEAWACLLEGLYVSQVRGGNNYPPEFNRVPPRWRKYQSVVRHEEASETHTVQSEGGLGSVILERIIEHDPDFFTLLCESRTDPTKIEDVRERMNAIMPDLYEQLRDINISSQDGQKKLMRLEQQVAYVLLPKSGKIAHLFKRARTGRRPYIL